MKNEQQEELKKKKQLNSVHQIIPISITAKTHKPKISHLYNNCTWRTTVLSWDTWLISDCVALLHTITRQDRRIGEGAVKPSLGNVSIWCLGQVNAVPIPMSFRVGTGSGPRIATFWRQIEVVRAQPGRATARSWWLLVKPYNNQIYVQFMSPL